MKKSLKYKIVLAIVIIVCIMDVSFIFVNYVNYMNVNRNYTDSLAQTVANTCRLVVDGDSVTDYLDNRRRNTAYYEVWNKLIDYIATPVKMYCRSAWSISGMLEDVMCMTQI